MNFSVLISRECLFTVSTLTLITSQFCEEIDIEGFCGLLERLSSLTSLDMGRLYTDDVRHLKVLSNQHHLQLRTLVLDNTAFLCDDIDPLVRAFGGTLEVLNLGRERYVENETLHLLGSMCINLKQLLFSLSLLPDLLTVALGQGKFPLLEKIVFMEGSGVDDDVVASMCAGHPNIESITVAIGANISLSSVGVALSYCPRFQNLSTPHFDFTTVVDTSSAVPFYDLVINALFSVADWRGTFQSIVCAPFYNHQVRAFHCSAMHKFANDHVESVLDSFGSDLHILAIALEDDVRHEILERLFRECSQLRTLFLWDGVVLSDDLIVQLADQCHHIASLSLAGAANITDESICYLLQCMGHQLVFLYLEHCSLLNEPTLMAIVDHCAKLEALNVTSTGITADAIITHVIKRDCLLKLTSFKADPDTRQALSNFLEGKENGANVRCQCLCEM